MGPKTVVVFQPSFHDVENVGLWRWQLCEADGSAKSSDQGQQWQHAPPGCLAGAPQVGANLLPLLIDDNQKFGKLIQPVEVKVVNIP